MRKEDFTRQLSEMFRNGFALDLIDTTSEPDSTSLNFAEEALAHVDLQELYENSEKLNIKNKHPEFYDFLEDLVLSKNHDESLERDLSDDNIDEDIEEDIEELEENVSVGDSALKNLVGGEHTGKESDSNKWVEKDAYRQQLTDEYNAKMNAEVDISLIRGEKGVIDVTKDIHDAEHNVKDVTNVIKGSVHDIEESKESKVLKKQTKKNKKKNQKIRGFYGYVSEESVSAEEFSADAHKKDIASLPEQRNVVHEKEQILQHEMHDDVRESKDKFVQDSYQSIGQRESFDSKTPERETDSYNPSFFESTKKNDVENKIIGKKETEYRENNSPSVLHHESAHVDTLHKYVHEPKDKIVNDSYQSIGQSEVSEKDRVTLQNRSERTTNPSAERFISEIKEESSSKTVQCPYQPEHKEKPIQDNQPVHIDTSHKDKFIQDSYQSTGQQESFSNELFEKEGTFRILDKSSNKSVNKIIDKKNPSEHLAGICRSENKVQIIQPRDVKTEDVTRNRFQSGNNNGHYKSDDKKATKKSDDKKNNQDIVVHSADSKENTVNKSEKSHYEVPHDNAAQRNSLQIDAQQHGISQIDASQNVNSQPQRQYQENRFVQDSYESVRQNEVFKPESGNDTGKPDFCTLLHDKLNNVSQQQEQSNQKNVTLVGPREKTESSLSVTQRKTFETQHPTVDNVQRETNPQVLVEEGNLANDDAVILDKENVDTKTIDGAEIQEQDLSDGISYLEIYDEVDDNTKIWETAQQRAEDLYKEYESGKLVSDSYSQAGQVEAVNLQSDAKDDIVFPVSKNSTSIDTQKHKQENKVDIGVFSTKRNGKISLKVGNNNKTYTVRSDGTVVVEGVSMNVYTMSQIDNSHNNDSVDKLSNKHSNETPPKLEETVFVGYKDATLYGGKVTTTEGYVFEVGTDGYSLKENPGNINMSIARKVRAEKMNTSLAISVINTTGTQIVPADFVFNEETKTATAEKAVEFKYSTLNVNNILRSNAIHRNVKRQGMVMHIMLSKQQMKRLYDVKLSQESIDIMVKNYNKILASNIRGNSEQRAKAFAKMNKKLENVYLNDIEKKNLADVTKRLDDLKLTRNVDTLKSLINENKLSGKKLEAAVSYVNVYDSTREQIIRKGVLSSPDKIHGLRIEHGFYAASMEVLLNEYGLPENKRALKKLIKKGNLTEEQKKIVQNSITISNAIRLLDASESIAVGVKNSVKNTFSKAKNLANKYMSMDYTMHGILISTSVVAAVWKSAKIAYKTINKLRKAAIISVKTANKVSKVANSAVRAGSKAAVHGAKFLTKNGIKASVKAAKNVVIKRSKKSAKFTVRQTFKLAKGSAKTLVKAIIHILKSLVMSLFAMLGPIILLVVFLLILIFSILSWLNNQGDSVYYDAGDEDTSIVLQEMVDVLTLCNDSFKTSLSAQFSSTAYGGGASGNDDSALQAPQMKKGDSSPVEGLYSVTKSSWWNYEFTYQYIHGKWANGTKQQILDNMFTTGQLTIRNNGNYAFVNNKMYMAAFGSYWGQVGDVLKVEFNDSFKIGDQPESNIIYIIIADEKAWKDTGYPSQPEGIYGHSLGNGRDFAEFIGYDAQPTNLNSKGLIPVKATNMGNIISGTCDMDITGSASSTGVNADILYRQEIDQDTYREIISQDNNIYYTFPEDQHLPDGITPTPAPEEDEDSDDKTVYAFYNNNQELISMVLAMFDFDINNVTSVKKTLITTKDTSGSDDETTSDAFYKGVTSKINDDTWRLIAYLDEYDLDLEDYSDGGYDDLRYSALVGLYNASHIVAGTPVYEYHAGPDGTINPVYNSEGRIIGQNNTDGLAYQVLVYETKTWTELVDGKLVTKSWTGPKIVNGEYVYETKYTSCPGHKKNSAAVITLHFDALLDLESWWEDNIYNVEDFDNENPNYSSNDPDDDNYHARQAVLKNGFQYIKKPDFYKAISGTCGYGSSSSGSSAFTPGTMTESQVEVARTVYNYITGTMGLSSEQAYGILVNIKRECDFNYTLVEVGGSGYGLCQWTGGRRQNLIQWCNTHPEYGSYNSLSGQLAFLDAEINNRTGYGSVWTGNGVNGFLRCTTALEAGEYFIRYFERPAATYMNQRIQEMASDIATIRQYIEG